MQNKMKKAAAVVCLGAMALTSVPAAFAAEVPVNAQQESEIMPIWDFITQVTQRFNISNKVAKISCTAGGHDATATKVTIKSVLQVKDGSGWSDVTYWNAEGKSNATVYETYSVTAGKTYRVVSYITVWEGGKSEPYTAYSEEKTA